MLTFYDRRQAAMCDGISRRGFLQVGALGMGGLSLANLLRLEAKAAESTTAAPADKAVIMIYLDGGPSHVDIYDIKPHAPVEYRSEFKPIRTNVPGMHICELLPKQASIADKLAIVRNMAFVQSEHDPPEELLTGYVEKDHPALGSVVSRLRSDAGIRSPLPPYVAFDGFDYPAFLGNSHRAFVPAKRAGRRQAHGTSADAFSLSPDVPAERLSDRRQLLQAFDRLHRNIDDFHQNVAAVDTFTSQALEMISSSKARDAFDISREPASIRAKYGAATQLLQARRLVEAGVKVVSLTFVGVEKGRKEACGFGGGTWDTHGNTYKCLGHLLPQLDEAIYALVTDLAERGLDKHVGVVAWGEFGRSPRITPNLPRTPGRNHWPQAGFALMAGGDLKMGQVVGATDDKGGLPIGQPYMPQNVLATLYHVLGINPGETLPDRHGRPRYLLDDRRRIEELV